MGFPSGASGKNLPANARDTRDSGLSPGSGRSLGVGNGNLLHYFCLENCMDRGTWWVSPWGCKELDMTEYAHTQVGEYEYTHTHRWIQLCVCVCVCVCKTSAH